MLDTQGLVSGEASLMGQGEQAVLLEPWASGGGAALQGLCSRGVAATSGNEMLRQRGCEENTLASLLSLALTFPSHGSSD